MVTGVVPTDECPPLAARSKDTVIIHHIVAKDTIDEQVMKALKRKDKTQTALIDAVKANLKEEVI
jgi:SNF2 family DNA or RNA helicase